MVYYERLPGRAPSIPYKSMYKSLTTCSVGYLHNEHTPGSCNINPIESGVSRVHFNVIKGIVMMEKAKLHPLVLSGEGILQVNGTCRVFVKEADKGRNSWERFDLNTGGFSMSISILCLCL